MTSNNKNKTPLMYDPISKDRNYKLTSRPDKEKMKVSKIWIAGKGLIDKPKAAF